MVKDEPVGPRFFRILVPGFATKLPIPHVFIKHVMKDKNRKIATLVSSTGKIWNVDIYKISKDVCFGGEGWKEFVHAHNLSLGYMLVFRYRGNMVFRFRVYGLGSCEELHVRYNHRKPANERNEKMAHGDEQSSDSSSENRSESPNIKSRRNIVKPLTKEHKSHSGSSSDMRKIPKDENTSKTKRGCAKKAQFTATIGAVNLKRYMNIPSSFRDIAGLSLNDKEVCLRDPKSKTWVLGLYHTSNFSCSYIMRGWRAVVRENGVEKGDNYVFELMAREKGIMHMQMRKL